MENNNTKIDQETLASILEQHRLWVDSNGQSGKRADLSRIDLHGANLVEVNLIEANLVGTGLRGANLFGANLLGADLLGADLRGANLCGTSLLGANLVGADLLGADLRNADLREAYLREADLRNVDLREVNLEGINLISNFFEGYSLVTDNLQRKLQSSEKTIKHLKTILHKAQSKTEKNEEEIEELKEKLKSEQEKLDNILNNIELSGKIKDAQKSLSEALKNTDKQIKNNEASASCFSGLGMGLFSLAIVLLIFFSMAVLFHPEYISEKKLNILFYSFPIITLMLIGTTCLRQQKNLLGEIRHFSNMKHQIELYSGLLEASQHAAVSFNNPEKANEYVQETFTQIRNRLLNSQYLPDHSSSDNQSDSDFGSDKVIDLLSKIADLSGKKSI